MSEFSESHTTGSTEGPEIILEQEQVSLFKEAATLYHAEGTTTFSTTEPQRSKTTDRSWRDILDIIPK